MAEQQPCYTGPGVVINIELNMSQQCVLIANKPKPMQLAGQDSYYPPPLGTGESRYGTLFYFIFKHYHEKRESSAQGCSDGPGSRAQDPRHLGLLVGAGKVKG